MEWRSVKRAVEGWRDVERDRRGKCLGGLWETAGTFEVDLMDNGQEGQEPHMLRSAIPM